MWVPLVNMGLILDTRDLFKHLPLTFSGQAKLTAFHD